mgnify:CR=1 FL=1
MGVFLQVTRTPDGRIPEPKLGAALIAAKAQVPLLPVSLWGTHRILTKGQKLPQAVPLTVRIGQPLPPPPTTDKTLLLETTQRCAEAIHQLHDLGR